jgi:hypothetical protein
VQRGDEVVVTRRPDQTLTVRDIVDAYETGDAELVRRIAEYPEVAPSWTEWAERQQHRAGTR